MTCAALALLLAAPPPGMAPDLWQHLRGWEAATAGVTSLVSTRGTKTVMGGAGVTTTYDVEAWFLKPDRLRLRLDRRPAAGQKPDPNDYATYFCTPGSVFEYDGPTRTATEYPAWMTEWAGEHPLLAVLSGRLTARQLATRYVFGLVKPGDPTYLYLELLPLRPKDQAEFDKMTLVLVKPGLAGEPAKQAYLPRMAQLVKPPGRGVETWDFPDVQANPAKKDGTPIGAADFEPLDPGPGWKVVKAVRPNAH